MVDPTVLIVHILFFFSLYFEVFLLITFFEKFGKGGTSTTTESTAEEFPTVTIIIPFYNEEDGLIRTMKSLLALEYPKDKLKVVAVNDGSTDNSWDMAQQFADHPQVMLLTQENGGKHTALNLGLSKTESELVGCLDADSLVDPMALQEIVRVFMQKPDVSAVTPAMKIDRPKTMMQHMQKAEYEMGLFLRRAFSFLNGQIVTPGPFSIFRRSVFEEIGQYRPAHNTEDLEIALRMHANNLIIDNSHTAFVYTKGPSTFKSLFKQRVRWVYGFLKNAGDYKFLFFQPKYGHTAMFTLPMAVFAIVSSILLTFLLIHSLVGLATRKFVEIQTIGFSSPTLPSFDWFFINTESATILTIILVFLTIVLLTIGKKLSHDHTSFKDVFAYLMLYGFLAPIWLTKAVIDAARSKQGVWTEEIDAGR